MKRKMLKAALGALALASMAAAVVACGGGGGKESSTTQNQSSGQSQASQQPAIPAKLYLSVDTVRGTSGLSDEEKTTKGCVQESKYPLGAQIVWRVRVMDPKTGQPMDDKTGLGVQVKLSDGQVLDAKFGNHGGTKDNPADSFWAVSFKVPTNYPTGSLDFTVVATDKEGRTGQWNQFKVASAMLQIVDKDPLAVADFNNDAGAMAAAR